jgi:hypothetical protein
MATVRLQRGSASGVEDARNKISSSAVLKLPSYDRIRLMCSIKFEMADMRMERGHHKQVESEHATIRTSRMVPRHVIPAEPAFHSPVWT